MKKFIRNVFVALALLGSGAGLTSCDSETLQVLLPTILELLMGGQTQTYSGTAEVEGLVVDKTSSTGYSQMPGATKKTVAASATVQVSQNTATITLTQVEIGGRTLTNLQVRVPIENGVFQPGYQWPYTCERQYGTSEAEPINVPEITDTYHYDLLSGSIQNVTENSATLTFVVSVYMGEEAYNITYKGQLVQQ